MMKGLIKLCYVHRNAPLISHALFAYDTVIFMNVGILSITNLGRFLKEFECSLGQKINKTKSSFYLLKPVRGNLIGLKG